MSHLLLRPCRSSLARHSRASQARYLLVSINIDARARAGFHLQRIHDVKRNRVLLTAAAIKMEAGCVVQSPG